MSNVSTIKNYLQIEIQENKLFLSIKEKNQIVLNVGNIIVKERIITGALVEEQLNGVIDNENRIFTTTYIYESGTCNVFYNGRKQKKDFFEETGNKEITLCIAPSNIGEIDDLQITYIKVE